jgi:hypothetical protein
VVVADLLIANTARIAKTFETISPLHRSSNSGNFGNSGDFGNLFLLNDLADRSRAHRPSAFADGKTQTLFHGHRRNQLDGQ